MSTLKKNMQRKRRLAKRGRRKPRESVWDWQKRVVFKGDSELDVRMRGFCDRMKAQDAEEKAEAIRRRKSGTEPDWREVLAFVRERYPRNGDGWKHQNGRPWTDAEMIKMIKSSWWSGMGSHGDGGNWWSRVARTEFCKHKGIPR